MAKFNLKVAPVPQVPQFDDVTAPGPLARVPSSLRRESTRLRFEGMSDARKKEAFTFRPLVRPRTRYSLLATLVVCMLLILLVGVPYAANERMAANPVLQTAIRGLIVGIWMYFLLGAVFLITSPTLVRGGFHPRFLFSMPLTLGPAVGLRSSR